MAAPSTDIASPPSGGEAVSTYTSYEDAQRAVDYLSDNGFPVEHAQIVGSNLRLVEQVTGRVTTGSATLAGAGSGAWFGLFIGLLGPAGIFASLAILVFLNIASFGATYMPPVMAPFWQFLNHFWIGAAAVNAERAILYFDGQGVGWHILVLLAWAAIVALLLLPVSQKLERRRERTLERRRERTPTTVGAAA